MKKIIIYIIGMLLVIGLISADIIIDKYSTKEQAEDALSLALTDYEESLPELKDITENINYKKVTPEPICVLKEDSEKCYIEIDIKCPDNFVCMNDGWIRQSINLQSELTSNEIEDIIKLFVKDSITEMTPEPVVKYDYNVKKEIELIK